MVQSGFFCLDLCVSPEWTEKTVLRAPSAGEKHRGAGPPGLRWKRARRKSFLRGGIVFSGTA